MIQVSGGYLRDDAEFRRLARVATAYAAEHFEAPTRGWLKAQGFSDLVLHLGGYYK